MSYENLLSIIHQAADLLKKSNNVFIVSHFDADGLSSAIILASAVYRIGIPFQLRIIDQLDIDIMNNILSNSADTIILADFGSVISREFFGEVMDKKVIIIDHHEIPEKDRPSWVLEINPHEHGFNGSVDVSSAGLSYLLAKHLNEKNIDLVRFALAGAIGDQQDQGPKKSFIAINSKIVNEGVESGYISVRVRLLLSGSPTTTPIVRAIANTTEPYLMGLSGDEQASYEFLKNIGINPEVSGRLRTLAELNENELKLLASRLVLHILGYGGTAEQAENLYGHDYIYVKDNIIPSIRELSAFLNACGRLDMEWYPIEAFILGKIDQQNIIDIMGKHRQVIAKKLEILQNNTDIITKGRWINAFKLEDVGDRMMGVITTIALNSGILDRSTVAVGITKSRVKSDYLKISARALRELTEKGINVGKAISKAAEKVGGIGGGHDAAGGAQIPEDSEKEFIEEFDKIIDRQISGYYDTN
ncbi:MAG: DHHA1 domain-containing protein [Thermoprotei archaeon]